MNDVDERLTECFTAVLPNLKPPQVQDASTESVRDWDSLVTVTLVSLIEESFGIQTEPEEIEHLTSYQSIRRYLQTKIAACNAD